MAKAQGVEELIQEAVERALSDSVPRPLHGTRAKPGVFLSSGVAAKAAAQRCLELGLIEQRGELRTRSKVTPLYGIAPAGIAFLLEHDPLRQLLAAAQDSLARLVAWSAEQQQTLIQVQQQIGRLDTVVRGAAEKIEPPDIGRMLAAARPTEPVERPARDAARAPEAADDGLAGELFARLQEQKRQSPLRPLDLPQLYRLAQTRRPQLTLGRFHDVLRSLAAAGRVRLSPFTQAMYLLPEPECGLLVGREIMYYVEAI